MEKNNSCEETTRRRGPSSWSSRETWTQTMRAVTVKVAVPMTIGRVERERWYARGTRSSLAATATPFAWRIDLYADVDPGRTVISIDASTVTFACEKVTAGMWPTLRARDDDAETARRRDAAEREAAREETRAEARRDEEKRNVARAFVEKQWAIDDALVAATSGETRAAASTEAGGDRSGASLTTARDDVDVDVNVAPRRRRASSPPPVRAFIDVTVRMTDVARAPARERRAS